MITSLSFPFHRTLLALAVCALCVPAQVRAEEAKADEAASEGSNAARPDETTISVGLGALSGSSSDRAQFGQYNGARNDRSAVGMLGLDYSLRNPASATWVDVQGSNLLGDTRELNVIWKRPGDWKLSASYGELVRYDPNTINTGLLGAGSATPQVLSLAGGAGSGTDFELKTKRTSLGLGIAKWITPRWQLEVDFKSENKNGARLFGIGMNCPSTVAPGCNGTTAVNTGSALLMLPEPIDANHSQIEARLSYAQEKLRLSFGYYGSFYRNGLTALTPSVPGTLNNPIGNPLPLATGLQSLLGQPLALSPDNQAHQFDLSGSYDFAQSTRGTLKLAYGTASQDESFTIAGPAGINNLGGKVTTTLAKIGLTSRPLPKLSLLADLRYEDKDDQTPIALYNVEGGPPFAGPIFSYTNRQLSSKKINAKFQAGWQFNSEYRGTISADYQSIARGDFTASSAVSGLSALRQDTAETGLTAELRRRMSENLSGAISLSSSQRDGSNWLRDNSGLGVTEVTDPATAFTSTAIFPSTLTDRKRDKVKLFADWQPTEDLALQFSAENGTDKYSSPSAYGLRDTRMNQYSVDWTYAINYAWGLNGFASRGVQTLNQSRPSGYVMALENTSVALGLGVAGKTGSNLELGANLSYGEDKGVYAQTLDAFAGADSIALLAATGGLPDVKYRQTTLKMFGKYPLNQRATIRVDLVHQRNQVDDWTWSYNSAPFSYSDGTTLTQKPTQNVSFIGITYIYRLP